MEKNEISQQEVEVFRVLSDHGGWLSNAAIAGNARDVAPRTVRAVTTKLVKAGILEQAEVFPGHRFKVSEHAKQRNRGYLDRLTFAAEVFGVPLTRP